MSTQSSLATGLISLVVAGAGAVGIYNISTGGALFGSCSSGANASTGESAPVGLNVAAMTTSDAGETLGSCCAAPGASAIEGGALIEAGLAPDAIAQTCAAHPLDGAALVAGEPSAEGGCCAADAPGECADEQVAETLVIETPAAEAPEASDG